MKKLLKYLVYFSCCFLSVTIYSTNVTPINSFKSGANLGISSYSNRLKNREFSLSTGYQRYNDIYLDKVGVEEYLIDSTDSAFIMGEFAFWNSTSFSLGFRGITESYSQKVWDKYSDSEYKYGKSLDYVYSVTSALTISLLDTSLFGLQISFFGEVPLQEKKITRFSYLDNSYLGVMLLSGINFSNFLKLDLNLGGRFFEKERLQNNELEYEYIYQSLFVIPVVSLFNIYLGYDGRTLELKSTVKDNNNKYLTSDQKSDILKAGIEVFLLENQFSLEFYGGSSLDESKKFGAGKSFYGLEVTYLFKNRNHGFTLKKSYIKEKIIDKKSKAKPRLDTKFLDSSYDIEYAESELEKLKIEKEKSLEKLKKEKQKEKQKQAKAYLKEYEKNEKNREFFEEIESLPDVTDEEYFWEGLD